MREIIEAAAEAKSVLMSLHRQPDGDSIGSTIAVARALERLGKRVRLVTPDPIPHAYDLLPDSARFVDWPSVEGQRFDLVFLLDCADEYRTGAPHPLHDYAGMVINIDHHQTNGRYGDLVHIDPSVAACGEIAARIVAEMGVTVDREIALALYVAIETDTGSFRYSGTTPDTHRLAARLLDAGIDPGEVSEALYERQSQGAIRLLARALSSLVIREDLGVAYFVIRAEDFAASGATAADAETLGIVNYARMIETVEVGALLRQEGASDFKLSLRSKGNIDVSEIAQRLGGGGHPRAAGANIAGSADEAVAVLLSHFPGA